MLHHTLRLVSSAIFALASTTAFAQSPAADNPAAQAHLKKGDFKLVAPFPPGGPIDVLARLFGTGFTNLYGVSAVIDNKPGAHGNIGITQVQRAPANGKNLLVVPAGNMTINPTLLKDLPYNVEKDFTAIAMLAKAPNALAVFPNVPVNSVQELIALAKAKPGTLAYGSPGVGSGLHLAGELLKESAGIDLLHIPYKGTTQALNDALGGQIQVILGAVPTLLPYIQAGKLRALAVTGPARSDVLPDLPTLEEAGVKDVNVVSWYGLYAPRATPDDISAQLARDVDAILSQPEIQKTLKAQGLEPSNLRLDEFRKFQADETETWRKVITAKGIVAG